jgi:hypothetical protein
VRAEPRSQVDATRFLRWTHPRVKVQYARIMDAAGITWLDWVMAVLTVLGFVGTGYGIYQAWSQARKATTAADLARKAVTTTRAQLVGLDLMNELRFARRAISDLEMASERNEPEIAKFTLVQLAESMRRAATLAGDDGAPAAARAVVDALDTLSREASVVKADLARKSALKVRTATAALFPRLTDLSHQLLEIETKQKYVIKENPDAIHG